MNLISLTNRSFLFASVFLLTFFGIAVLANSQTGFTINNKPVPQVVATVNGTVLTANLLKREMIAYRLMMSRQGQTLETKDEEEIARGLLMKAIDTELIYQQGLDQDINIDSGTIDR